VAEEMDDADKQKLRLIGIVKVSIDEVLQSNWLASQQDDLTDVEYQVARDATMR
jgi:hypothetical protein